MSLRNKIIFFGTIILVFGFALLVLIYPNAIQQKGDEKLLELNSPMIACASIDNYKDMLKFSELREYESAQKYIDKNLCERLETGTKVLFIKSAESGIEIVRPAGRTIHLYIASEIKK